MLPTRPKPLPPDFDKILDIALGEMTAHVTEHRGPFARRAAALALRPAAVSLAKQLAAFDHDLASSGNLRRASLAMLARYGVRARLVDDSGGPHDVSARRAALPERGPLLVVSNHPGLYDAVALFAAIGREDLAVIAAERDLLAALPNLGPYLVTAPDGARAGYALRKAERHLERGGALLHFAAGCIEPDPRLVPEGQTPLLPWKPGTEALVRLAGARRPDLAVVAACVSGVVSPRARTVAGLLGRRGELTDAVIPLLQLTLPLFGDVDVRVAFGPAMGAEALGEGRVEALRSALARLADGAPRRA